MAVSSFWLLGEAGVTSDIYRQGSHMRIRDLMAMAQPSFKRYSLIDGSYHLAFLLSRQKS